MAPHSSTLAWKIPWTEEPGGLQSMGSLRVGHDWETSLSLFTFTHWRRKWQPTPVFLPGESQGQGSLVGCRLWGRTESDTTEATQQQQLTSFLHSCFLPSSFLPLFFNSNGCISGLWQEKYPIMAMVCKRLKFFLPCWKVSLNPLDLVPLTGGF